MSHARTHRHASVDETDGSKGQLGSVCMSRSVCALHQCVLWCKDPVPPFGSTVRHFCAHAETFLVIQEVLSCMLGARRAGVTMAAVALQRLGLITYRRGRLTVLDRRSLKATACRCYSADRAVYAEHIH